MISFDDFVQQAGIPIYVQIVLYLKRAIVGGIVQDGDELPSRRVLSARLGVNPNTIQKAYRILEEEGLISSHAGAKSLVVFDQKKATQIRRELLEEDARRLILAMRQTGLSRDEALTLVGELWEEEET